MKNILLLCCALLLLSGSPKRHPIHLSIVNIEHNLQTHALEVSCRFFIEDFEAEVEASCGQKLALGTPKEHAKANVYIEEFLQKNFTIIVNGKPQKRTFIGKEADVEGIWIYMELTDVRKLKSLEVENLVLLRKFDDQRHFVNIKYNGEKKAVVLDARKPRELVSF